MAELHEAEVYHADFSPGNVLYDRTEEGVRFSLIDINRMYFGPVSLKRGCANFSRLWGREAAFHLMAETYARAGILIKRNASLDIILSKSFLEEICVEA